MAALAALFLTFVVYAADISGRWWTDLPPLPGDRGGSVFAPEFEFKVAGDVLTGSTTRAAGGGRMEWVPLAEGKISGDAISFTAMMRDMSGVESRASYTGKITGSRIDLKIEYENGGEPRTIRLKRAP